VYRVWVPGDNTRRVLVPGTGSGYRVKLPGPVTGSSYRVCWVVQFIIIWLYNSLMRRNIDRQTATRRHVKLSNTKQKLYSQERFRWNIFIRGERGRRGKEGYERRREERGRRRRGGRI